MRKKFLFAMAFAAVAVASNAQDAYVGNKFFDNWYIGVKGGGITPTTHSAFWKNMRGVAGVELDSSFGGFIRRIDSREYKR